MHRCCFFLCFGLALITAGCHRDHPASERTPPKASAEHERRHDDHPHEGHHAGPEPEENHGVEYVEDRGLLVPSGLRESLGVRVGEVGQGRVPRTVHLALRVFETRAPGETTFAAASVDRRQASFLRRGQRVTIPVASGETVDGEIAAIHLSSLDVTGLAEVIVRMSDSRMAVFGHFLDGTVEIPPTRDSLVIPKEALLTTAEGNFAYLLSDEALRRVQIGIGARCTNSVEVTSGLRLGQKIVLHPVKALWLAELHATRGGAGHSH